VDDRSKSVDVRAPVDRFTFELFRRHVVHRSNKHPGTGCLAYGWNRRCPAAVGCPIQFRDTKVEQLGSRLGQHDVGGLQIAVRDALPVCGVQRIRHMRGDVERLCERQRSFRQPRGKRFAFEVFDDDVVGVTLAADVVENGDVRMIQVGDSVRLALEPFA
jgi:hypothetical protein